MTRLLCLPDDKSILLLETPLSAQELIDALSSGKQVRVSAVSLTTDRAGPLTDPEVPRAMVLSGAPQVTVRVSPVGVYLSPRQCQVLLQLSEGLSTRQIAARLRITPRAVLMHIAALKEKLGAGTRAGTISRAVALGLLEKEEHDPM